MRIYLYIDGDNFFYVQKDHLGWRVDFERLLDYVRKEGDVAYAGYYTGTMAENSENKQTFLRTLGHLGFTVIRKQVREVYSKSGEVNYKVNLDPIIIRDICLNVGNFDKLWLVTGDGDFSCVIDTMRARGLQYCVASTRGCMASELREAAGVNYLDLQDVRKELELDPSEIGGKL